MNRLTLIIAVTVGLSACEQDKVLPSDVDLVIANQAKSNDELIKQMTEFIDKHGKEGFESSYEIVKRFVQIHEDVKNFNATVDKIAKRQLAQAANGFVEKTFSGLPIEHPYAITVNDEHLQVW